MRCCLANSSFVCISEALWPRPATIPHSYISYGTYPRHQPHGPQSYQSVRGRAEGDHAVSTPPGRAGTVCEALCRFLACLRHAFRPLFICKHTSVSHGRLPSANRYQRRPETVELETTMNDLQPLYTFRKFADERIYPTPADEYFCEGGPQQGKRKRGAAQQPPAKQAKK